MTDQEPTFAEAFEQLRLSRGISPADLATALHVYEANVSRWRRGGGIGIANVRKIADFFDVDRAWLERLAGFPQEMPRQHAQPVIRDPDLRARYERMEQLIRAGYPRLTLLAVLDADLRMAELAGRAPEPPVIDRLEGRNTAPDRAVSRQDQEPGDEIACCQQGAKRLSLATAA